jgi:hypothetical protein
MHLSIKFSYFFTCCNFSSITGWSIKRWNAHTRHLYACGQSALWNKINLKFTGKESPLKLCILANITAHHFFYLMCCKQLSKTKTINTGIVRNANKILYALAHQGVNGIFGNAAQTKTAKHKRIAILYIKNGFICVGKNLIHI